MRMETSVMTDVMVSPQPDMALSPDEATPTSCDAVDPVLEFSRRLNDIIRTHGSAAAPFDSQDTSETEMGAGLDDITAAVEKEVSLLEQSLKPMAPQEQIDTLLKKYAHLSEKVLTQQSQYVSSLSARRELETLCKEIQTHYHTLKVETLQRCSEDEQKREEMTSHFQEMLTEIRAQIEQHSSRNDNLCRENANLSEKLEGLIDQCERREVTLGKLDRHHDLQQKLAEAKLEEANAMLAAAEEKHKREKEYLLRETLDKTKKCFTMREEELNLKKKLTLYAQKFAEFQETLAKSNQIYVHFKQEMENMSEKMQKLESESDVWKNRFQTCNKALSDMMEERTAKAKEYDLFVLKIQRLETLCRTLQDERSVLYLKIKDVRQSNSETLSKGSTASSTQPRDQPGDLPGDQQPLLTPQDVQEIHDGDLGLTEDMSRLKVEQAKLQEFANALLATTTKVHQEDSEDMEMDKDDPLVSAYLNFKSKAQAKDEPVEEVQPQVPQPTPNQDPEPQVQVIEEQENQPEPPTQIQEEPIVPASDPGLPPSDDKQEVQRSELEPEVAPPPTQVQVQEEQGNQSGPTQDPVQEEEEVQKVAVDREEPAEPSPEATGEPGPAQKTSESSRKQAPKKKKKRSGKNAS